MNQSMKNSRFYQSITSGTNELERIFKEVDENQPAPDLKKILLILGLGTLSWISTYSGLLELIKANSGDIAFTYKLAIGFAVAMLMLMIVYILDQLFSPLNWAMRTVYIAGYIFLTIISVGFGFGFYWKFLESRSEATRSAESAVTQVQNSLQAGQTRLEQLETTLASLTALSAQKAIEEREKGNSCPNSRPGDGPRRRLRDEDAKNFKFAGNFITQRSKSVADDIKKLNSDMAKIASRHPSTVDPKTGTRNAFLKNLNQRLDLTITRFNAFRTDPQLTSIRNNLAERSNQTIFPNGNSTFKCPDSQLQGALRGVVQAIDGLPVLGKPSVAAVEGSEATIEAFKRLAATLKGVVLLKLPPSEDQLRKVRKKAVRSVDQKTPVGAVGDVRTGLNERDYIPLAIAVFVDFCLLLVSINRPMDRLKSLVPVMKDARDGPISGILSSFHATHFAGIREEFSLFQHVVFDWGGHYYVAVPLASNDIQAQYLANLFVSLEGRGIVDRAMIPPTFIIRGKLKKMGSSFADHGAFRLYKFRNGAWSNIVLDAVMGAARDVAIENAALRSEAQLPNPEAIEEGKTKRAANFASLFSRENTVLDHETGAALENTSTDNSLEEQRIELPRLFRSKKDKKHSAAKNTKEPVMTAYGQRPPVNAENDRPLASHQMSEINKGLDNPATDVKNGADIIRWPNKEKAPVWPEKKTRGIAENADEPETGNHDRIDTAQKSLTNNTEADQLIDKKDQIKLDKQGQKKAEIKPEESEEKPAKTASTVKEAAPHPFVKISNPVAGHARDLQNDAHSKSNDNVAISTNNLAKPEIASRQQPVQQEEPAAENNSIAPQKRQSNGLSRFEKLTTVKDHIAVGKITNWFAGEKNSMANDIPQQDQLITTKDENS